LIEADRPRRLTIIYGDDRSAREEHAKALVEKIEKHQLESTHSPMPRGIAVHLARYPLACEDCGETYWSKDAYGTHMGCRGEPKKQAAGFGIDQ
jgi:hypothetical protein